MRLSDAVVVSIGVAGILVGLILARGLFICVGIPLMVAFAGLLFAHWVDGKLR